MRAAALVALLLLMPLCTGCVLTNAGIRDEVATISWDLRPMEFDTQAELRVGRSLIGLATTVARWSDDDDAEFVADLLDDIEVVDLGVYTLIDEGVDSPGTLTADGLEELRDLGWQPVVRTSDHREGARWVLHRTEHGLDQMLVVGIEDDELVVLRLTGRLGGLLDNAIRREDDLIVVAREIHDEL